jgi:hypothetical protein
MADRIVLPTDFVEVEMDHLVQLISASLLGRVHPFGT